MKKLMFDALQTGMSLSPIPPRCEISAHESFFTHFFAPAASRPKKKSAKNAGASYGSDLVW
jgi:hypothetical protein